MAYPISPTLLFYYPEGHAAHAQAGHPECPERVEVLRSALRAIFCWDDQSQVPSLDLPVEVLHRVHTPEYLALLKYACSLSRNLDADTYTTPASWDLALHSAGGAAAVALGVWQSKGMRGLALTRPAGHHAGPRQGMGYCLLNNVALTAQALLQQAGARRLAIIDLDLHHGNGTQEIFWQRDDVFFVSIHQAPLFPGTGALEECGDGAGEGFTANFPLPPGSGDEAYRVVATELILPLLDRYLPEMLLISFGFDPHWRDPKGHLRLSAAGYGQVIKLLADWADRNCNGRTGLFLEGGYDLEAGAACIQAAAASLLALDWDDPLGPSPRPEGKSWRAVVDRAQAFWHL